MHEPNATQPAHHPSPIRAQPAYQPPQVNDLGRWQAVTLIQSVPVVPGPNGYFGPTGR